MSAPTTVEAPAPAPTALDVKGIWSGYGQITVLRDVDLSVPTGAFVAVLGPNGAGKTTLLKTIAGLIQPSQGTISLGEKDVTKLRPHARRRENLCYIPEGRGIFRSMTVRENLRLQSTSSDIGEVVDLATEAFPVLGKRLRQTAGTLSGGEQQMLAMAQAYIERPAMLLVDEASLGLAPRIVDTIFEFLVSVNKRGTAVLLVDQFIEQALSMATCAYLLSRGEIVRSGDPSELAGDDVLGHYLGHTTVQEK
ncbi:ABC transporter ATP-binding protein [Pseudofrankia asymbiotica]|uniref:ABC transporter ATP-binding protein n=1 Tax=Pseudofrankia asymbiotica TaxID=1834516 RepID=A0A1V2I5J0_9ACTN|nr:ABC transporter ATP-binding protein [Pseudofrankia asymbiotica]ONH26422.1 ABC transporter ATP-binding protein [Pseudofrankia asymbiotica]